MIEAIKDKIKAYIASHEAKKNFPYLDTKCKITIGIGRNLSDRGISNEEMNYLFENDSEYFYSFLTNTFPWFSNLNEARQIALVDMCFMGIKSFLGFNKMIDAIALGDMDTAAEEILNSEYHTQVGQRAVDNAAVIKTGILPHG